MNKSYKIILNPIAGHGNGLKALPQIEQLFSQRGVSFDLQRTEHPGHGIDLTRQAVKEGYQVIVAAGGDGTVNDHHSDLYPTARDNACFRHGDLRWHHCDLYTSKQPRPRHYLYGHD